ncbi:MAG TPA: hypothetical protein VFO93_06815 [Hymenobacter sp.]|uniref:hypothetical protein n=1 Tax=Hymenobacter sp. TaxID=1898978 RepID=UPI002D7F2510|nr:hypothetical protein [Hymenobacter sp.]HET9503234.1 hypothetical protein [Hymenobacter sp.]
MRYFFLLLALLVATGAAVAQNSPVTPRPDSLVAAQAAPDTAAAIHRLFAARRARSYIITGLLVVPGALGFLLDGNSIGTAVYPIAAAPYEVANLISHRRYRRKAEERALVAFQAQRLSPKIRRKLKSKYFTDAPAIKHF